MSPTVMAYSFLAGAIIFEVTGTTFLVKSEEFTKLGPTAATVILYAFSFYCLTKSLREIPLGVAYALWGGIGIVLTVLVGFIVFKQTIDMAAVVGISLIVVGVIVVNLFSSSVG